LTALALPNSVAAYMRVAPWLAWRAMRAHRSQFVWYRRLHVLLSRYTYVNTLWRCVTN
jgi:N-acetylglucosaminylphosphatidylinositol deacetylase